MTLPLSLYSPASSFFGLILSEEDALEPAKLDVCDAWSDASDGRWFSSLEGFKPLDTGGFLPKGLRKGGMLAGRGI